MLILVVGLTPTSPVIAQSTTGNIVTLGGDNNGGVVAGGNIINTPTAGTKNGSLVSWLIDNATWLGSLAAIATITALFLSLLSRKRSACESPSVTTVTAKGGSVAIGGDSINSKITISSTSTNGVVGSSDNDSVTNQDNVTRVLLVFANPSDTDPLRVQEESRALHESIQLSAQRSHFQFETLPAATIDDLRRALLKNTYDIVHFSGHGTNNGLAFEDAMGKEMVPSSEALAQLLIRHQVGTAIFNACHSLSVGSFSSAGLNYTIATTCSGSHLSSARTALIATSRSH